MTSYRDTGYGQGYSHAAMVPESYRADICGVRYGGMWQFWVFHTVHYELFKLELNKA